MDRFWKVLLSGVVAFAAVGAFGLMLGGFNPTYTVLGVLVIWGAVAKATGVELDLF